MDPSPPVYDVETFEPILTFDHVIVNIYKLVDEADEINVSRVCRLIIQKLWYCDELNPKEDNTLRVAAMEFATRGRRYEYITAEDVYAE